MGRIGPDELGRLFESRSAALVLYARQWCDRPEAEDVVQEAFVALAGQSKRPDQVGSWLYRVVRNRAISLSRGVFRRRRREAVVSRREEWFASVDDQLDSHKATSMLAELAASTREVIVARVWGGLTFEEVARLQGCSLATAYRRYHEGLSRLQERLDGTWATPSMSSGRK